MNELLPTEINVYLYKKCSELLDKDFLGDIVLVYSRTYKKAIVIEVMSTEEGTLYSNVLSSLPIFNDNKNSLPIFDGDNEYRLNIDILSYLANTLDVILTDEEGTGVLSTQYDFRIVEIDGTLYDIDISTIIVD